MQLVREEPGRRTRGYFVLVGAVALIAGFSVVSNLQPALEHSVAAATRTILGMLGLGAAALMWTRPAQGRQLGILWALLQIPFVAVGFDGGFTAQSLSLPLALTFSHVEAGRSVVSAFGINLVGVIFAVWLSIRRDLFED